MKAWYKNLKDKVTHLFKVTRTVWSLYTALICVAARGFDMVLAKYQSAIFNPWKVRWNWIPFYQNSFVISPGLLYHLIRRDGGRLSNEAFTSNPIVSSKQWFNGFKNYKLNVTHFGWNEKLGLPAASETWELFLPSELSLLLLSFLHSKEIPRR